MTALLNVEKILDNIHSEEVLLELSKMESIYAIRKLTAAARYAHFHQTIIVDEVNEYGQAYSARDKIWFNADEWMEVKYEEDCEHYDCAQGKGKCCNPKVKSNKCGGVCEHFE